MDTAAHWAAINAKGKTIAVLGTPLDEVSPRRNEGLQELIAREHLAVTQFAPGSEVTRVNFAQRNRTTALLSHVCVITDARTDSGGTQLQGREALRVFYAGTAPKLQVEITGPIRVSGVECAVPMLAELTMNDNKLYVDVVDCFVFDETGKITSMRAFWSPAEMRPTR